jgi:hypothetical protein
MADDLPDGWLTLVCPPGAQDGKISEGAEEFVPYRENHLNPSSRWLVRVPRHVAQHLCWNAGFYVLTGG